ncbi:acyl-CoA thioesterase [Candidatus Aminicenantes bacterium AC-335-O07]|jgi:acyl-CoA thioester hydrolase|nr:acyl-CoA thioesterase [Candidatus Aminicenantes bacterium AC-335-O07]
MKNYKNFKKSGNNTPLTSPFTNFVETVERVRYSEVDQMGVAHNVSYFEWFEIGRTDFCRKKAIPYGEIEEKGYYFVVAEAFCRYRKPLHYDEEFIIRTSLDEITNKKAIFSYQLLKKDDKSLIAEGYTVHVVTNSKGEVTSLPPEIFEKFIKD